ncbi:uncharacterized protein TrAtP1_002248 [Trichoderma atroviride]|uniref:uncharacterized protein n=1 Tax=Hypocrea atroviridis TaxID=63577 RepID=UPI00332B5BA5|nr:hypothetical protein TrAtP1_002248 [Trichoderma atroviride]
MRHPQPSPPIVFRLYPMVATGMTPALRLALYSAQPPSSSNSRCNKTEYPTRSLRMTTPSSPPVLPSPEERALYCYNLFLAATHESPYRPDSSRVREELNNTLSAIRTPRIEE